MPDLQTVTMTFFHFAAPADRWWAFRQMGRPPFRAGGADGPEFVRLVGSGGGNGFSILPNLSRYGLLAVWRSEAAARAFLHADPGFRSFREKSRELWTVYMHPVTAHGRWDGAALFRPAASADEDRPVAVLTRATIRPGQLWRFWRFVPRVSRSIENREGCLFSVGIGELPLIQQATFSLWRNSRLMKDYAYHSRHHREVIHRTRELNWYQEELFARFRPFAVEGEVPFELP